MLRALYGIVFWITAPPPILWTIHIEQVWWTTKFVRRIVHLVHLFAFRCKDNHTRTASYFPYDRMHSCKPPFKWFPLIRYVDLCDWSGLRDNAARRQARNDRGHAANWGRASVQSHTGP